MASPFDNAELEFRTNAPKVVTCAEPRLGAGEGTVQSTRACGGWSLPNVFMFLSGGCGDSREGARWPFELFRQRDVACSDGVEAVRTADYAGRGRTGMWCRPQEGWLSILADCPGQGRGDSY
jgi:hypothetical protein